MFIKHSKLLYRNALRLIKFTVRNESDDGSIREAGGKFAEMQEARERQYFQKKNQEYLDYIRQELKKGRTIEDVIEDTKDKLKARAKCKDDKRKGIISENEDCDHL